MSRPRVHPRVHPFGQQEAARVRRLRSLLALFALYAAALLSLLIVSDGPEIGCILAGIAGHVLYATGRTALAWRDAAWMDGARARAHTRLSV